MANQIGNAQLAQVQSYIDEIKAAWEKMSIKGQWTATVDFLLKGIDYLIRMVESLNIPGADKKATVIAAVGALWDQLIVASLPIYLKPFAAQIKSFLTGVVLNVLIDFIVSKYNTGSWTQDTTKS